jgi:pimeloyl-ACP methyl ester carboxylesterase
VTHPQGEQDLPPVVSDHEVATDGGALFARVWQPRAVHDDAGAEAGAAILLFHDSLGCVELWRDFPAQLATATGRAVVAYDRLGFGRSAPHPGRLPVSFVTDEATIIVPQLLAGLRHVLPCDEFVACGHSVGGGMAVATAAHLSARCRALITVSAQSFVEDRTRDGLHAARIAFQQPGQIDRLARYHGAKAPWVLAAWLDTWLDAGFAGWTLDALLPRVLAPTLVLHGDADEFGSVRHPERIAAGTGGPSRMVVLEGGGHVPHREQPARVLDEITRFLGP